MEFGHAGFRFRLCLLLIIWRWASGVTFASSSYNTCNNGANIYPSWKDWKSDVVWQAWSIDAFRSFTSSLPIFHGDSAAGFAPLTGTQMFTKSESILKKMHKFSFAPQDHSVLNFLRTLGLGHAVAALKSQLGRSQRRESTDTPSSPSLCVGFLLQLGLRQFKLIVGNLAFSSKFLLWLSFVLTCRGRGFCFFFRSSGAVD